MCVYDFNVLCNHVCDNAECGVVIDTDRNVCRCLFVCCCSFFWLLCSHNVLDIVLFLIIIQPLSLSFGSFFS